MYSIDPGKWKCVNAVFNMRVIKWCHCFIDMSLDSRNYCRKLDGKLHREQFIIPGGSPDRGIGGPGWNRSRCVPSTWFQKSSACRRAKGRETWGRWSIKFLESGHTQRETDSMHSSIERAKRNVSIFHSMWTSTILLKKNILNEQVNWHKIKTLHVKKSIIQLPFPKYNDLKGLCAKGIISKDNRAFYNDLRTSIEKRNCLDVPDCEKENDSCEL